jgi:hypothetical protein
VLKVSNPDDREQCADVGAALVGLLQTGMANLLAAQVAALPEEEQDSYIDWLYSQPEMRVNDDTGFVTVVVDGVTVLHSHVYDLINAARWSPVAIVDDE